jgi:hypothetical protein
MKTPQKTFAEHWAWTTQILLTNSNIRSHTGNSKFLGTPVDNRSTHLRNHLPDAQKEEVAVEEEMVEEDYLLQQDQACSLHTDELLTQNF